MADSRRKLNRLTLRPAAPLQIPEIEADRDDTVGCLRYSVLAAIALLVLALAAVVGTFAWVQYERHAGRASMKNLPPGGVTVAVKQSDPSLVAPEALEEHETSGPKIGGFAMDLGSALSFSELSQRFADIAGQNAELQFDRLEPRATLRDTIDGIEARLLVGPFATHAEALQACTNIALPAGIECRPVEFEGERIARE